MKTLQDLKNLIEDIEKETDRSLDEIPLQFDYITDVVILDLYLTRYSDFEFCRVEIS
jgi:hypothetical protein